MDVQFRFPPPIQLLFHEQAKSIVALQELQNEVSGLLEFKNVLLESYPHLGRVGSKGASWNPSSSSPLLKQSSSSSSSSSSHSSESPPTNVSDSGFGNSSSDLKDSSSLNLILRDEGGGSTSSAPTATSGLIVDELNGDELLLLLDVIHRKTVRMRASKGGGGDKALPQGESSSSSTTDSKTPHHPEEPEASSSSLTGKSSRSKTKKPSNGCVSAIIPPPRDDIVHSVQIRTCPNASPLALRDDVNSVSIEIKKKDAVPHCRLPYPIPSGLQKKVASKVRIELSGDSPQNLAAPSSSSPLSKKLNTLSTDVISSKLSELNLSKIGKTDRLDLRDFGPSSSLKERGGDGGMLVRENKEIAREKIRKVLHINNVIELQRQLLGTVIENEFYKSHLEKLWEAWSKRIKDYESQNESLLSSLSTLKSENESLQASLSTLKSENESLKSQVLSTQQKSSILQCPPAGPSLSEVGGTPFSWTPGEANKGLDDEIVPGSRVVRLSPSGQYDSPHVCIQPDSLLQQQQEEEGLPRRFPSSKVVPEEELFYDSISDPSRRKLLIPPQSSEFSFSSSILNHHPSSSTTTTPSAATSHVHHHPIHRASIEECCTSSSLLASSSNKTPVGSCSSSSHSSTELRRIPITEKLKRKILGW